MGGRSSAIVGRDDELWSIQGAIDDACAGRGGSMFVAGDSGIGKTRLVAAAHELGSAAGMRVLRGRASTVGPAVPFRPLTEALLALLRSGEELDIVALGPYHRVLARLIPDWAQMPAEPVDVTLVVLAEAVLRLVALVGQDRGCLVILDDLQDADVETLAVVEYLVDNLDRQPVLLLGALRDGPCPALDLARSASQRAGSFIQLGRLSLPETRQLAGQYLRVCPQEVPASAVEILWAGSAGNPLHANELISSMVDSGFLVAKGSRWVVARQNAVGPPTSFDRSVAWRFERLDSKLKHVLSIAAVFGQRFQLTLVQAVSGLADRELLSHLFGEPGAQFAQPDVASPDWYTFRHQLIREVVLSSLIPAERTRLAEELADAVEAIYPGLPGDWCQTAAVLRLDAGAPMAAGRLFAEAGRRALTQGAAMSSVGLLTKAWDLLTRADAAERADTLEQLLYALAEAGLVVRAFASVDTLGQVGGLDPRREARLRTRLAWAAMVTDPGPNSMAQITAARTLLGPDADEADIAPVDVVGAHLLLDVPGPGQLDKAIELAAKAAEVADRIPLPVVACQAWQLLGSLQRSKDPVGATACLERAHSIAVRHDLPIWEIHALVRLGNDDALRDGGLDRLEQARIQATHVGAVTARYQAEQSIALYTVLEGDFAAAESLVDQVFAAAARLNLVEIVHYVLLVRATLEGHRGHREGMEKALTTFRGWGGNAQPLYLPRIHGLARAFCSLLEEDRERAMEEQACALRAEEATPTVFHLAGGHGLHLLLQALSNTLTHASYETVVSSPAAGLRWDRMFALFARAVLVGKADAGDEATAATNDALAVGAPFAMGRHLGLRLVAEAAIADGWGTPVEWLQIAERYFRGAGMPTVAGACVQLQRDNRSGQVRHKVGVDKVPSSIRSSGITVREYEVLRLVGERLRNREIAERLHLSQRTVETHVSSLLAKTGQLNRIELGKFALKQAER